MKTRYEESDNIVVRATRTVTDKLSDLFGMSRGVMMVSCHSALHVPLCLSAVYTRFARCCHSGRDKWYQSLEVHRSSVNAVHRPNASAWFGSAALQHSAELR